MVGELWFYFWFYATTVLICTGYTLLMQRYPEWKIHFSVGLAVFIIGGGALVYFDAKKREDIQTKMQQLEGTLELAQKEADKQKSLTKDATDKGHLLREQLEAKSAELSKVLKDKPQIINGEIKSVRIFPWQGASARQDRTDDGATASGILVFARLENEGASTILANWELSIELPDHTIIRAQEWPGQKTMRILCRDAPITISKNEYLDVRSKQEVEQTEERSGVIVWMVKQMPLSALQTENSFYTLTIRDKIGVVHALKKFSLTSLPQKCSGFEVLD